MGPVGWTDQGAGLGRGHRSAMLRWWGAVGSARTQRSITSRWDAFSFHLRHVRDLRSTANDNDDGDVLRNVSSVGPQAPVGAVGYRLVFPSRTQMSHHGSPQLDGNGYQGSYSPHSVSGSVMISACAMVSSIESSGLARLVKSSFRSRTVRFPVCAFSYLKQR